MVFSARLMKPMRLGCFGSRAPMASEAVNESPRRPETERVSTLLGQPARRVGDERRPREALGRDHLHGELPYGRDVDVLYEPAEVGRPGMRPGGGERGRPR